LRARLETPPEQPQRIARGFSRVAIDDFPQRAVRRLRPARQTSGGARFRGSQSGWGAFRGERIAGGAPFEQARVRPMAICARSARLRATSSTWRPPRDAVREKSDLSQLPIGRPEPARSARRHARARETRPNQIGSPEIELAAILAAQVATGETAPLRKSSIATREKSASKFL